MQEGVSMPGEAPPAVSEDCLYLNVSDSVGDTWCKSHLPVLGVDLRWWLPEWVSRDAPCTGVTGSRAGGVIVVSIAYRLGPLGFLAHPRS